MKCGGPIDGAERTTPKNWDEGKTTLGLGQPAPKGETRMMPPRSFHLDIWGRYKLKRRYSGKPKKLEDRGSSACKVTRRHPLEI